MPFDSSFTAKPPELLAPAGSMRALEAAIDAGADAVYFGARDFNARGFAENFSEEEFERAFSLCRAYGVRSYVTLNTLCHDRELSDYLRTAEYVWKMGADALIAADLGGAAAIRRMYPEIELHGSTQMSGHGAGAARALADMGFSRMVLARETPLSEIKSFVQNSPIEAEIFVHGALCVSHSGQCLFSSIVGGRSGNRGECAQPCRLPFGKGMEGKYPLSLKDLCLAAYIPEIIESGAASLKIEGRMKSPEYVHAVTSVYRRLLDERRGATAEELRYLSSVFSRGGFTDGYFTERISHSMLGVRSEADKGKSRQLAPFDKITRRLPVKAEAVLEAGKPSSLTFTQGERSITVFGETPNEAENVPMTEERVLSSISKLGDTPFYINEYKIDIIGKPILPMSALNALRRSCAAALFGSAKRDYTEKSYELPKALPKDKEQCLSARFYSSEQITDTAMAFFDRIFLPLQSFSKKANGVILPPVIFDGKAEEAREMLRNAEKSGAKYALAGNVGHLSLLEGASLKIIGDFRLNIFNRESVHALSKLGIDEYIPSPELTLPQIRDLGGNKNTVVYGRLPLMLLEKCVIKEVADCKICEKNKAVLTDRKGITFPVLREWEHRNTVYNSLPTYMGDKKDQLLKYGIEGGHFIFSTESPSEVDRVIEAYKAGRELSGTRRIKQ